MNLYQIFSNCRWRAKTNVLGVSISNFLTNIRYFEVEDEESNLYFKLSKGGDLKKVFGKPWSKSYCRTFFSIV